MKKEITLVRTFNKPVEQVWSAWVNSKELAKWWGPNGVTIPISEIDFKVGGALYIVMLAGKELGPMAGQKWPMNGIFKEIIPAKKIVYSNNAIDEKGNILLSGETTAVFEQDGDKTKLTVTTGAEGTGAATATMLDGMEMGWNQQLDKLVKYLA